MSRREHEYKTHSLCELDNCFICDGGLAVCVVCGQAEAELEDKCPGPREKSCASPRAAGCRIGRTAHGNTAASIVGMLGGQHICGLGRT